MDLSSIFSLPPPASHAPPSPVPPPAYPATRPTVEQPLLPPPSSQAAATAPPAPTLPQPQLQDAPPYAEMIFAAVRALNERDGSSKQAIAKYINNTYPNLPPVHSTLLDKAIITMKKSGQLILVKKSYKIPGVEPVVRAGPENSPGSSVKRGRGRPKKQPKGEGETEAAVGPPAATSATDATLMSLGLVEEPMLVKKDSGPGAESTSGKRGRGRPPKTAMENGVAGGTPVVPGSRKRGRPKKNVTAAAENGTVDVAAGNAKSARGRPKRIAVNNGPAAEVAAAVQGLVKRGRGRPRVNFAGGAIVHFSGRPRGRPRKAEGIGSTSIGGAVTGKKRGRPPGRKSTGRPVGRPRKTAEAGSSGAFVLSTAAQEDVLRKFEYVQMKIKEALSTLRHQCTGSISTVDAIQELEGIASMEFAAVPLAAPAPVMELTNNAPAN